MREALPSLIIPGSLDDFMTMPCSFHVPSHACRHSKGGFTLVELSIVIAIMGILVGLGIGLVEPMVKRAKYNGTKDRINAALESIASFAASNNSVPTTSEFSSEVRNPRDAWSKDLYYIPDADLDDLNAGGVCGRKTTGITVRDCTNAACTSYNDISNVAFVVISGSDNHNIQTDNVSATVKVYEVDTASIDDYTTDMDRPEEYDDIVYWMSLNELRIKSGCVGAPLKIANTELPRAYQETVYNNVKIYGDGGVPYSSGGYYRWCREESEQIDGITFSPNTKSGCISKGENAWGQADNLTISGAPTESGTFNLTFFVRDDNDPSGSDDNLTQKTFVLTINMENVIYGCVAYRVWNNYGSLIDYYRDSECKKINNGDEITGSGKELEFDEVILRYSSNDETCTAGLGGVLNYTSAVLGDTDEDCCLNFDGTDRDCSS